MQGTSAKSYLYLGLLISCSLLYVLFQGGKVAMMLFLMGLILVGYVLLGRWSGIAHVIGNRKIIRLEERAELEAGMTVQIQLDFRVPGFWPLPYVLVKDTLRREGGEAWSTELSFVPDWKRRGKITYETPPLRRGVYSFGQTECSTEDVFGLFRHQGMLLLHESFRVEPRTVIIPKWLLFNQLSKGLLYHSASIKSRRETTQINGVREYVYGDRLSRIHWNASARTGTWKSKEFERESLPRMLVVLDAEQSRYSESDEFELAVSIAASILRFSRNHGLASGLLINSDHPIWKDMKADEIHYRDMADTLVRIEANGKVPVMEHLQAIDSNLISQTFVVCITSLSDSSRHDYQHWLESEQLPGSICYVTSPERDVDETMVSEGKSSPWLNRYIIQHLDDLPQLLGGEESR